VKGSRAVQLLVGLTFTLAACGVPESGVIQAGDPAVGMSPAAPPEITVFFQQHGRLVAYTRAGKDRPDVRVAVGLLFDGPTTDELADGVSTDLPRLTTMPEYLTDGNNIDVIRLPGEASRLSVGAMEQLVCTVADVRRKAARRTPGADPDAPSPATAGGRQDAPPAVGGAGAPVPHDVVPPAVPTPVGIQVLGDGWALKQSDDVCPDLSG
jgi:hypothetical protein